MRILQIVPTLGYGGIAQMILNYYKNMNQSKFKFDFITHGVEEDFHKELIKEGSQIFYVDTIRKVGIMNYFKRINQILKQEKYQIIHFHTAGIRLLLLPIVRYYGAKKILVHAHSTKVDKYPKWLWRFISVHYATDLVACGEQAGRATFGNKSFTVIPNAVNINDFIYHDINELDKLRADFNISKDCLVLGHVGAFIDQKNQIFIAKLLKKLSNNLIDFKMIFVGEGPNKAGVENYINENKLNDKVIFTGKRNDVNKLMGIFDLFLLPSLYEGLPVVGVEAQSSGCFCLFSTNVTPQVDLGLGNCLFLDISNEDVWVDQILKCLKYKKRLDTEVIDLLEKSEFNIKVSAKKLEKLYEV